MCARLLGHTCDETGDQNQLFPKYFNVLFFGRSNLTFGQVNQRDVGAESSRSQTDQMRSAIARFDFEGVVAGLFADFDAGRRRVVARGRRAAAHRPIMSVAPLRRLLLPVRLQYVATIGEVVDWLVMMVVSVEPSPFDSGGGHHRVAGTSPAHLNFV